MYKYIVVRKLTNWTICSQWNDTLRLQFQYMFVCICSMQKGLLNDFKFCLNQCFICLQTYRAFTKPCLISTFPSLFRQNVSSDVTSQNQVTQQEHYVHGSNIVDRFGRRIDQLDRQTGEEFSSDGPPECRVIFDPSECRRLWGGMTQIVFAQATTAFLSQFFKLTKYVDSRKKRC
jgi:hypothetical protein